MIKSKYLWNFLYLIGKTRWDTGVTPPELVEVVEGGQIPPGRALDIGCGTGTNSIYLAQHNFQTVGVDIASLAIWQAKRKVRKLGMQVNFYAADILSLGMPEGPAITIPFDFTLDIGCLFALSVYRRSYSEMLKRVLRVGGFHLLYTRGPGKLHGRFVGLTPEETQITLGSSLHAVWTREGKEGEMPSYWSLFQRLS